MTDARPAQGMSAIFAEESDQRGWLAFTLLHCEVRRTCQPVSGLAAPQNVVAVAEMNDGAFLMTQTFVQVATNGCV